MSHQSAKRIDLCEVERRTGYSRARLDWARMLVEDPHRDGRLAAQECVPCFYSGKLGGAMCCSTDCGGCGKTVRSRSTNVPRLCKECAKKLRLCRHCGADLNLKDRRKLDLAGIEWTGPQEGGAA